MSNFLSAGTKAPVISVQDQDGNDVSLADLKGKKVALFLYPQDGTPTCTTEACNLRDNHKALHKAGYTVIGLSPDSPRKHRNFIKKYELPFPLWSDPEHRLIEAFGAWGEKQMFGNKYMGVFRSTFIIDEKGVVEEVIEKVKAKEHAEQIVGS
ncbi:MAG: thioredoxin-dependent thiol peroxidase [Bacteroidia bacterium]